MRNAFVTASRHHVEHVTNLEEIQVSVGSVRSCDEPYRCTQVHRPVLEPRSTPLLVRGFAIRTTLD
jgi:hypothetical protein